MGVVSVSLPLYQKQSMNLFILDLYTAANISNLQVMSEREVCDDPVLQEQCGVPDYRCGKCGECREFWEIDMLQFIHATIIT